MSGNPTNRLLAHVTEDQRSFGEIAWRWSKLANEPIEIIIDALIKSCGAVTSCTMEIRVCLRSLAGLRRTNSRQLCGLGGSRCQVRRPFGAPRHSREKRA